MDANQDRKVQAAFDGMVARNQADIRYYDEAAKAFAALAKIIRAYDAYRARGVIPAADEYANMVAAINDARSIMGPQFRGTNLG